MKPMLSYPRRRTTVRNNFIAIFSWAHIHLIFSEDQNHLLWTAKTPRTPGIYAKLKKLGVLGVLAVIKFHCYLFASYSY